jgi:hypothetical protein
MQNSPQTDLYELLVTQDFEPDMLDARGAEVSDPADAQMFSFDWKTEDKNYGTVVILFGEDKNLKVFFGDNLGRTMDSQDKTKWYEFLQQIKQFSVRNNLMGFEIENLNRLKYTMQGLAAIKEGLFEGYYGNRKISYSDQPKKTRLVIKHSRPLGEGEARFRNVESLFIETDEGERFKLPFTKMVGGRAMARHVSEGGTPYDAFGQHIAEIVAEMNTMSKFVRAAKNKQFSGEAAAMVESAVRHYSDLKAKAKRMISQRGYHEERNSFDPAAITDAESAAEYIRTLFTEQSLDARIEEAIPLLARLAGKQQDTKMKEINEFETWANTVTEGTWAIPDTPATEAQLKLLMSKPLPVGADATNATEQLYDLIGDDELFDQLADLAERDANADARPVIQARLAELGIELGTEPEPVQSENLDTDGVMMTRPSNMSSESIDPLIRLRRLL